MKLKRRERPRSQTMRPAVRFLELAAREARIRGDYYVGTEHLLLALLASREGPATVALERLGAASAAIRDRVLGSIVEPAARRLDADALATVGIDLEQVRSRLEETFGPGALERTSAGCMSITPPAKLALAYAVDEAGDRPVSDIHVLVGLLRSRDSLAARVLEELGVTLPRLRATVGPTH